MSDEKGFILSDILIGFVLCTITITLVFGYFQLKSTSEVQIRQKLEESEERIRQAMDQQSDCQKCIRPTPTPTQEVIS